MTKLRCDMCHKPLKGVRHVIKTLLAGAMVVGPECFRKEKKARKEMLARHTPKQLEDLRAKMAARIT